MQSETFGVGNVTFSKWRSAILFHTNMVRDIIWTYFDLQINPCFCVLDETLFVYPFDNFNEPRPRET